MRFSNTVVSTFLLEWLQSINVAFSRLLLYNNCISGQIFATVLNTFSSFYKLANWMASWILSCCIRIHYSLNNGFRSTKFQNWIEVLQYNLGSSGPEMYPRVIKVAWLAIYFSYQEMTIFEIEKNWRFFGQIEFLQICNLLPWFIILFVLSYPLDFNSMLSAVLQEPRAQY